MAEEAKIEEVAEVAKPVAEEKKPDIDIQKILDENDRKWQSRFDKIVAEKKDVTKTVEQRIEQIERERKQERVAWARKEAKAKAGLDDDIEAALLDYSSDDVEAIATGAEKIKAALNAKMEALQKENDELKKKLAFGSKVPAGGMTPDAKQAALTQYNDLMRQGRQDEANQLYVRMMATKQ